MKRLLLLLLLLSPLTLVEAATRYVPDQKTAALRAGPTAGYKIIKTLPSGTALEVLQVNQKAGFTQVRTSDGTRGWVQTRDLTDKPVEAPVIRDNLATLQKSLDEARAENDRLKQELAALAPGETDIIGRLHRLADENQRLNAEITRVRKIAEGSLNLDEQNRSLQERLVNLERDLQITRQERQALADSQQNTLFLTGAAILIGGLLLGWLLPVRPPLQRDSWRRL
jgi:SH3 domain protein